jgi:hypothetical protein
MSFWQIVWFIFISFAFIAYLMILFTILTDLFRDHTTSGWMKAVWIVCLIVFPLITSLVYLITKSQGMAERRSHDLQSAREQQEAYIRSVAGSGGAGTSPSEQISHAKQLLDTGAITEDEFASLKAKALA